MIQVQFYFTFIFLFDPSWSESIRVDLTRTGSPSWSGPTFVPASYIYAFTYIYHQQKFHILLLLTE